MREPGRGPSIKQVLINYKEPFFSLPPPQSSVLDFTAKFILNRECHRSPHYPPQIPPTVPHTLGHWFSKCRPQSSCISITWKLMRKENPQAPPQTFWIRDSGGGSQQFLFISLPDDSDLCSSLRTIRIKFSLESGIVGFPKSVFFHLLHLPSQTSSLLRRVYSLSRLTFPTEIFNHLL